MPPPCVLEESVSLVMAGLVAQERIGICR